MFMLRSRALASMMLGHFTVDSYVGVIPVMYPILIHRFSLNLETVALVSFAYIGMGSLTQPLFGLLADRFGTQLIGLTLIWTAGFFAIAGFVSGFPALVAMAAVAGVGSGAFHPMGAVTVRRLAPRHRVTTAMSAYVTMGTVGVAAGPLVGVILLGAFGLHSLVALLLPGGISAVVLLAALRRSASAQPIRHAVTSRLDRALLVPLAATIGVMASRSWTNQTMMSFTPTWYHSLGYQPWFYGALATTIVLSSAIGTLGTGSLAMRYGKRAVMLGALVLSIPAIVLFAALPGPWGFAWAIALGALAGSTPQLMLLIAQELVARRAGFASGLILGLGFVAGAIGAPVTGMIADRIGLQWALGLQAVVVALTIPIAMALPSEERLRRLNESSLPDAALPAMGAPLVERPE